GPAGGPGGPAGAAAPLPPAAARGRNTRVPEQLQPAWPASAARRLLTPQRGGRLERGTMTPLRQELEAPPSDRTFGSGWVSGVLALVLALLGLGAVLCLLYPELLTVAAARTLYNVALIRLALHFVLLSSFFLGILSIVLRKEKVLGFTALAVV